MCGQYLARKPVCKAEMGSLVVEVETLVQVLLLRGCGEDCVIVCVCVCV